MKFEFKTTCTETLRYVIKADSYDEAMQKAKNGDYDEFTGRVIDAEYGDIFDMKEME